MHFIGEIGLRLSNPHIYRAPFKAVIDAAAYGTRPQGSGLLATRDVNVT